MIHGWDLGGAHVKLAVMDRHGRLQRAVQTPCELWLGLDRLEAALRELAGEHVERATHAITMTGELVDLFQDRASGVAAIVDSFAHAMTPAQILVFAGEGFVDASQVAGRWADIASANWLATARLVARLVPQALVIDVGSTTSDIIVVAAGEVKAAGRSDFERLAREELVYTGVVRTPVMAIAQHVPFAGERVGVIAEHFATMADVYRITGELDEAFDQARTAEGRGRSREDSMRRLARMIGCDLEQAAPAAWEELARWLAYAQRQLVRRACDRQLSRGLLEAHAPVVGLGAGSFLAARVAEELGREYIGFAALAGVAPDLQHAVDVCGPAFAVARLASALRRDDPNLSGAQGSPARCPDCDARSAGQSPSPLVGEGRGEGASDASGL
jgi:probable H4MPT-linked C1 transfer pathway protein